MKARKLLKELRGTNRENWERTNEKESMRDEQSMEFVNRKIKEKEKGRGVE